MSKFKVKLKIQSFELEIEGTRDDIPLISDSIGKEIAGLLEPAAHIVEGQETPMTLPSSVSPGKSRRAAKRASNGRNAPEQASLAEVIDWAHKPENWGVPQQSWTTSQKSIWLLYVLREEAGIGELPESSISATFNKHFKQSKTIITGNVRRDLGKLKLKPNAPVAEDTNKNPTTWYITQAGEKVAQELVLEARGQRSAET